jgi:hypothetical protein
LALQAPIKRPLSIKNTCPSQNKIVFCRVTNQRGSNPFVNLHPVFQVFGIDLSLICNQAPIRIKTGKRNSKLHCFFFAAPGPLTNPRKTSVPCHVQCIKIAQIGLFAGQPLRTHDRGRSSKKVIRLDLSVRQCNDVPITTKRIFASLKPGSPLQCHTNVKSSLHEMSPDLA